MAFACRNFSRSAGGIMNLNPKTDYRSYTSVDKSDYNNATQTDINKVAVDLRRALELYESEKKRKCSYKLSAIFRCCSGDGKSYQKNLEILDQLFESPLIQQTVIHKIESYKGPLPHPDILKKYDEIDPSFSKIIFQHFEKEQNHRHSIDNKSIDGAIKSDKRAQWMAFILSFLIITTGVVATFCGYEIFGASAVGFNIAGLIAAYLKGRTSNKD